MNAFIITGTATDFNFLNQQQPDLQFKVSSQNENYLAQFENDFNLFAQDNIGFDQFPPLEHKFGTILPKTNISTLLSARINTTQLQNPLLTLAESGNRRTAYLLGENVWKWRLESHLNSNSFTNFDLFTDKIIQYLVTNSKKNNLTVNYDSFYESGDNILISAAYFNKNYTFDDKAQLTILLKNKTTKATKKYDLLKSSSQFQVNLDGLAPGSYSFTVTEKQSQSKFTGIFEVADFELEKQFVNPDKTRLLQLAATTKGSLYYPNQVEQLVNKLVANENYIPIQKQTISKTPLIDWQALLIFLIALLGIEWFVRKYNGLL